VVRLMTAWCHDVRGDVLNWALEHHVPMPHDRVVTELQCWRVWVNLLSHATQRDEHVATGEVWVSDQTQADETGIHRRSVRQARELLAAAGLIERTDQRKQRGVQVWRVHVPYAPGQPWLQQSPSKQPASRRGSRRGSWRGSSHRAEVVPLQPLPGNDLAQVAELPTPQTELNAVRRAKRDAAPTLEHVRALRQQATADERARLEQQRSKQGA
jgi:hypothetical protein